MLSTRIYYNGYFTYFILTVPTYVLLLNKSSYFFYTYKRLNSEKRCNNLLWKSRNFDNKN